MSKSVASPVPVSGGIVLVASAPPTMVGRVARRLSRLFPQVKVDLAGGLAQAAADNPEARIVLALVDPAEAVAIRLEECAARPVVSGGGAQAALRSWIEETAPLLEITRGLRRRLWLVDARAMASGQPQVLTDKPEAADPAILDEIPPAPAAVYLALAAMLLRSDAQANRLAAEIAALRHGPGGVAVDLDQAFVELADRHQAANDLGLLRETHAVLQADLDAALQDRSEHEALKEEAERLRTQLMTHERSTQEVGLLREAISLLQTELERAGGALAVARRESSAHEVLELRFAALERKLVSEEELGQLRQEVLAAEILKMNGVVISDRARFAEEMQAARAEIARSQGARQIGQAEIAELREKVADAQAGIAGLQSQLVAAQAEKDDLQARMAALHDANADLSHQLQAAQGEVALLRDSTSWRVTAPMRAVKQRLTGQ